MDGMIAEELAEPWAKLRQGDPAPFARELQERAKAKGMKGCVLTFWGVIFISPDRIGWLAKYDIAVRRRQATASIAQELPVRWSRHGS